MLPEQVYGMPNPFLGVRIPRELDEAIAARIRETGQSKSDLVIAALEAYLGMPSHQERFAQIERRVEALEAIAAELSHARGGHIQDEPQQQHHHQGDRETREETGGNS